jgi:transcriptional regulator with PAS, ATPase and Fis domain
LLRVVAGPDEGRMAAVDTLPVTIGRSVDNGLHLVDTAVSRLHCELVPEGDYFLLRDNGSRNGTFVNGVRVFTVGLERGARVRIGETTLHFVEESVDAGSPDERCFGELLGQSRAMKHALDLLRLIAMSSLTCLLLGETGTGKELAARALHSQSSRAAKPFVVIDCAGVSPNLVEDKLFGHVRGSFTGAVTDAPGAFEEADGGTVFLDEIGELSMALQPKLLRVLERREVARLGSHKHVPIDVRVVAATHRDLQAMMAQAEFRKDLYYRLSEATVVLPPLRERRDDVGLLAEHIMERDWGLAGSIDPKAMALLERHPWPGNVRELRNVLRRVRLVSQDGFVGSEAVASILGPTAPVEEDSPDEPTRVLGGTQLPMAQARDEYRRDYLRSLLQRHGDDHAAIAAHMGVNIKYARRLMRRYGFIV